MQAELALRNTNNVPPTEFDFNGHWVNELKSFMDIKVDRKGRVTGQYVSAVSSGGGQLAASDFLGSVTGDLICFIANWGEAITTWVGHGILDSQDEPQILTLWQMVMAIPNETDPEEQWKTVQAGADTFTR